MMWNSGLRILFVVLCSSTPSAAQEFYGPARSLEEQQAVSQLGQAEYYTRMALRSLEASEKIGKAPFFNYQNAREDIEKVLAEFKVYLHGDGPTDLSAAMPLVIDGRYFAESINNFLMAQKTESGNLPVKGNNTDVPGSKAAHKNSESSGKKTALETQPKILQRNSTPLLPPPDLPQSDKKKRDKIEEILKKGL